MKGKQGLRLWLGILQVFVLIFIIFFIIFVFGGSVEAQSGYDRVTRILNELMKKPYDRRVRPLVDQGPLFVQIGFTLESITSVNEKRLDLTTRLVLRQTWFEPRLTFNAGVVPNDTVILSTDQAALLWIPDTVLQNERESAVKLDGHKLTTLNCEGQIRTSVRMSVVTQCSMKYENFPFDMQSCDIIISSYSLGVKDLIFEWDKRELELSPDLTVSSFELISWTSDSIVIPTPRGDFSGLAIQLHLRRPWRNYIRTFFSPMILFTFVSLLSLWTFTPRLAALVNLINIPLINMFLVTQTGFDRPALHYDTAIDQYITLTFIFVFGSLLATIGNIYFENVGKTPQEEPTVPKEIEAGRSDFEITEVPDPSPSEESESVRKARLRRALRDKYMKKIKNATMILCKNAYWILIVFWLLFNCFYWGIHINGQNRRVAFKKSDRF